MKTAAAVVGEAREITAADQLEVPLDGGHARSVVGTEPAIVPIRVARDAHDVSVGGESNALGVSNGGVELGLHDRRTVVKGPLVVDVGDGEVARELNRSSAPNGGV